MHSNLVSSLRVVYRACRSASYLFAILIICVLCGLPSTADTVIVDTVNVPLSSNANIYFSPYNWVVSSSVAVSVQPGAYFKTNFSGTGFTLTFDTSGSVNRYNTAPAAWPCIGWRVDGTGPPPNENIVQLSAPTVANPYILKNPGKFNIKITGNNPKPMTPGSNFRSVQLDIDGDILA